MALVIFTCRGPDAETVIMPVVGLGNTLISGPPAISSSPVQMKSVVVTEAVVLQPFTEKPVTVNETALVGVNVITAPLLPLLQVY